MNKEIKFILDKAVDRELNDKIIQILTICFPDQQIFTKQRYYKETPQYRWYIESDSIIAAHLAIHEKKITINSEEIIIGGIAEVCVHPNYRGKGLAKKLLKASEEVIAEKGLKFSVLFGDPNVYSSSGYRQIDNKIKYVDHISGKWITENNSDIMIKKIADVEWPEGLVNLNGPTF